MDDILPFPDRKTPPRDEQKTLVLVRPPAPACDHRRGPFHVDERLEQVECGVCHERLNAIWVLKVLAENEHRIFERLQSMRRETQRLSELLAERTRTQCRHCHQMTPISRR